MLPERPGWYQAGASADHLQAGRRRTGGGEHGERIGLGIVDIDGPRLAAPMAIAVATLADAGGAQRFVLRPVAGIGLADLEERDVGEGRAPCCARRRQRDWGAARDACR